MSEQAIHWSTVKERGTALGIWIIAFAYQYGGKLLAKFILSFVIAYFFATDPHARKHSRGYLQRLSGTFPQVSISPVRWWHIYYHLYNFGAAALDKVSAWLGGITAKDVVVHGENQLDDLYKKKSGAFFITSHLGNIEVCRALGQGGKSKVTLNVLVFTAHADKFNNVLKTLSPDAGLNLISVQGFGPETAVMLQEKIAAGEFVVMVGDRTSVSNFGRVEYVDFLGDKAPFSIGPFVLANLMDCPVFTMTAIKLKGKFNLFIDPFTSCQNIERKNRNLLLKQAIQDYANTLAKYCAKAPYQWFNFFDFWAVDDESLVKKYK